MEAFMRKIALTVFLLLCLGTVFAEPVQVVIGTGTQTTIRSPINGSANYSWSSALYLASEVNQLDSYSKVITEIAYYVGNSPVSYRMDNQFIYMRSTSINTFSTADYPVPLTNGFTLVYSGPVTFNGSGWNTIPLSTAFWYNGTDNLEICWENHDGSSVAGYPNFQFTTANGRIKNDSSNSSFPETTGNFASGTRANLRLTYNQELPYTVVSGDVGGQYWNYGTYYASSDVYVPEGSSLMVTGAVVVKFAPGAGLHVMGSLSVYGYGTTSPMCFTARDDTLGTQIAGGDGQISSADAWMGIECDGTMDSTSININGCTIRYAGQDGSANLTIRAFNSGERVYVNNCKFTNSFTDGFRVQDALGVFHNNEFLNNARYGVYIRQLEGGGFKPDFGTLDSNGGNHFAGNGLWAMYNQNLGTVSALFNDWGVSDPFTIDSFIYDDEESGIYGHVLYGGAAMPTGVITYTSLPQDLSPYVYNDDIILPPGQTLDLPPYTEMRFDLGSRFTVSGDLNAPGMTFSGLNYEAWGGLVFGGQSGGSLLDGAIIVDALVGVTVNDVAVDLSEVTITQNPYLDLPDEIGVLVNGSVSPILDGVVIENYDLGIRFTNTTRETSTPTLTYVRVRNSSNTRDRLGETGIRFFGAIEPQMNDVIVDGFTNGIEYIGTGSEGSGRDTPTMSYVRVRNSSNTRRLGVCGIFVQDVAHWIADHDSVGGYVVGIKVVNDSTRTSATPTMTYVRVRNSSNTREQGDCGIMIRGAVEANLNEVDIDGFRNGVEYTGTGIEGGTGRATPTMTYVRVRNSSNTRTTGVCGFKLKDLRYVTMERDTVECFATGVEVTTTDTRGESTPTMTYVRVRNSSNTRETGTGFSFGSGVSGLLRDSMIEHYAFGVNMDQSGSFTISHNTFLDNDIAINVQGVSTPSVIEHNTIYTDAAYVPGTVNRGISIVSTPGCEVVNNTVYKYQTGFFTAMSTVHFNQNIVWSPSVTLSPMTVNSATLNADYNLIGMPAATVYTGLGNINTNPLFVNAGAGDFHLSPISPCINAGNPTGIPDPDGTIPDLGAWFYDVNLAPIPAAPTLGLPLGDNIAVDFPGLFWNGDPLTWGYSLLIATNPDMTGIVLNKIGIHSQYYLFGVASPLAPSTTYYARLTACNAGGAYTQPFEWSFSTSNGLVGALNGSGGSGAYVAAGSWTGSLDVLMPWIAGMRPLFILTSTTSPTGEVQLVLSLGVDGSDPTQHGGFLEYLSQMTSLAAPSGVAFAFSLMINDPAALSGGLQLNIPGFSTVILYAFYSKNGGPWQTLSDWSQTGDIFTFLPTFFSRGGDKYDFALGTSDFTLPVEFSAFNAVTTAENTVLLRWSTQTETDMLGYNVYRADANTLDTALPLTPEPIDAHNGAAGATYKFEDADVYLNTTYYYWIECMQTNGFTAYHGPVQVTVTPAAPPAYFAVTGLTSAFPNPFNPNTTIRYSLEGTAGIPTHARLTVYNARGQAVRTLIDGEALPCANASVVWNGRDDHNSPVASGVYLLRLATDKGAFTRKVMMLK
jgi:hypothetical protein